MIISSTWSSICSSSYITNTVILGIAENAQYMFIYILEPPRQTKQSNTNSQTTNTKPATVSGLVCISKYNFLKCSKHMFKLEDHNVIGVTGNDAILLDTAYGAHHCQHHWHVVHTEIFRAMTLPSSCPNKVLLIEPK